MLHIFQIYIKEKLNYLLEKINIQNFLRKMSIKKRLIFSYLVLSFIPILFISIFSFNNTYRDITYKNQEFATNISHQVFNNINYLFDKYIDKFYSISHNSVVLADTYSYIKNNKDRNIEVKNRIELALASIVGREEGINSVTIYLDEGYRLNYGLPVIKEGVFFNDVKDKYMSNEIIWDMVENSTDNAKNKYIALSKKNNLRYGTDNIGLFVMTISRDYIDDICDKNISNNNHSIIITDQNGLIISHPDKSKILKWYDNKIIDKIDYLEKQQEEGIDVNNIFEVETNDGEKLVSYHILKMNNWKIINTFSKSTLMEKIIQNGRNLALIVLIVIFFSFVFLLIVTKSIILPVVNLVSKMEKVGKSDEDIEVIKEDSIIKDEHAILAQSFNNMTYELKKLMNDVYHSKIREKELEFLKKEAELNSLQQQINPHFLNNTLEVIFWKAELNGHDEIAEMVTALGNFFRTSINKGSDYITIADEIENVKNYIYIQKVRLKNSFLVRWYIEEKVKNHKTIKLILQPIIENAITYGLKNRVNSGMIIIKCFKDNKKIIFEISDNGIGMKQEDVQRIQEYIDNSDKDIYKSVGLKNVNQRIKLYFGDNYGIKIKSKLKKGTKVSIILPAFKNELDTNFQN